jgi:hypothetical protein
MGTRGPQKQPLPARGILFAKMAAQGYDRQDILQRVFGIDPKTADHDTINRADQQMSRWRKNPEYDVIWQAEIKAILRVAGGKAIKVLRDQLNNQKVPWLQNKAANDLLNQGKASIMGDDANKLTVQITGMPELGSPDQDDG